MRGDYNAELLYSPLKIILIFLIIWLAEWAGEMKQILHHDWLQVRLSGAILPPRDCLLHIINPLLLRLVRCGWRDIGQVFFLGMFMNLAKS